MRPYSTTSLVISAFFLLIGILPTFGQSIGLRGGVSLSSIDDKSSSYKVKPGVAMGAYYNYGTLTVAQVELNYEQKGVIQKMASDNVAINMNYLTVPLLFGVDISFVYLKLGPYWGYLADAKSGTDDVSSKLNHQDFGLVYCGGIRQFLSKKIWLELDARFNQGLLNVNKTYLPSDFSNQSYSIQLGLVYKL